MITYEPNPGESFDAVVMAASEMAFKNQEAVKFQFNGAVCLCFPNHTVEENRVSCRKSLGLPAIAPSFHPVTALDALSRWDKGESVFTIEMGGLGPGYEQAIHILVFELIRDYGAKPLPQVHEFEGWGDDTVHRINEDCGGFSGAQVGAAKQVAYRAIRDGWEEMFKSITEGRKIQVSRYFPSVPIPSK